MLTLVLFVNHSNREDSDVIINRSKDSDSIDKNDILRPNLVIWNSHYLELLLLFLSSSLAVVLREPTAPSSFHR